MVAIGSAYASDVDHWKTWSDKRITSPTAEVMALRCFQFYAKDAFSPVYAPDGRMRLLAPKASKIWAIAHRDAGKQTTMKAMAEEAMCCVSTVSRSLTRLQAWGFLSVDVKRGRNGGIVVRMATFARQFRSHIDAAWRRIRSWINVASRLPERVEDVQSTSTVKDATFTENGEDPLQAVRHLHPNDPLRRQVVKQLEDARRLEEAGRMITTGEWSIDYAQAWYDTKN